MSLSLFLSHWNPQTTLTSSSSLTFDPLVSVGEGRDGVDRKRKVLAVEITQPMISWGSEIRVCITWGCGFLGKFQDQLARKMAPSGPSAGDL